MDFTYKTKDVCSSQIRFRLEGAGPGRPRGVSEAAGGLISSQSAVAKSADLCYIPNW